MEILIFIIGSYVLLSISLYFLFEKVDEDGWKGLVPGWNFVLWCKLIGRSPWHAAWLLFPIVNIFIYCGMAIDMVRSFGQYKFIHSALAVIYSPLYFLYIAFTKEIEYEGPILPREQKYRKQIREAREKGHESKVLRLEAKNPYKKSSIREWVESIVFAVFAAAFIRMFLIEAYTIPTSSMEGSLLVGDYLFVSKAHYGIRTPMTVIQVPLLHNRIPILDTESYLEEPDLPYSRLPAFEEIDHNEPVVFNWPVGDSVYLLPQRSVSVGFVRRTGNRNIPRQAEFVSRPIDKTDFYIKRCIALPGDSLEIRNRQVFINGEAVEMPPHVQYRYEVKNTKGVINRNRLAQMGIKFYDQPAPNMFHMSPEKADQIRSLSDGMQVRLASPPTRFPEYLFPHDELFAPMWSVDNYGPIYIPKKGSTTPLNLDNLPFYKRIIRTYEGNELGVKDGTIYINGEPADSYTFRQNYYWMMGDNRHNSEDSRVWGYVPQTHIVGKPLFIWFSTEGGSIANGIRWSRLFRAANDM